MSTSDARFPWAWAQANLGRRAKIARRLNPQWRGLGAEGCVIWSDDDLGPALACKHTTWLISIDDVDFLDGRPAIIPRLVNGEWTWDGKDAAKRECEPIRDSSGEIAGYVLKPAALPPEKAEKAKKLIGDLRDRTFGAAPAPDPLPAAALRTLHFLADLVPLPGWSTATERELLACWNELKAALKGKGK